MSFVAELKRRKVMQVTATYLVVAWLILQVVDVVSGPLMLSDAFARGVMTLLGIGLPIVVVVSWAFDITSQGIVRDDGTGGNRRSRGGPIDYALLGLLVLAGCYMVFDFFVLEQDPDDDSVVTPPAENLPLVADDESALLPNSVAVLPLDNLSDDPEDANFTAGTHHQIISELANIADLTVIPRTSVQQYEGVTVSAAEVAQSLRVETVLEGSVRYAGDRLLVSAQLIDGESGLVLWSQDYDGDRSDVFGIQIAIATQIASELQAQLSPREVGRLERAPPVSSEAYDYYLRARAMNPNIGGFFGDVEAFHGYLDRAIELDPNFAEAMALKAGEYAFAAGRPGAEGYSLPLETREAIALGFAQKALAIDPELGLGHMVLGLVHRYNWRGEASLAEFGRAYQLSPNNDDILDDYSRMLSLNGHHEEAISIARRLAEIRPNGSWLPNYLARGGQLNEAADLLRADLDPTWVAATFWLTLYELLLGNDAEALALLRGTETLGTAAVGSGGEVGGIGANNLAVRTYLYGRVGEHEAALSSFEQLGRHRNEIYIRPSSRALAYLGIGDEQQALEWLQVAAADRRPQNVGTEEVDIGFNTYQDPVLDQPEFAEVRSRLGYVE